MFLYLSSFSNSVFLLNETFITSSSCYSFLSLDNLQNEQEVNLLNAEIREFKKKKINENILMQYVTLYRTLVFDTEITKDKKC